MSTPRTLRSMGHVEHPVAPSASYSISAPSRCDLDACVNLEIARDHNDGRDATLCSRTLARRAHLFSNVSVAPGFVTNRRRAPERRRAPRGAAWVPDFGPSAEFCTAPNRAAGACKRLGPRSSADHRPRVTQKAVGKPLGCWACRHERPAQQRYLKTA